MKEIVAKRILNALKTALQNFLEGCLFIENTVGCQC